MPIARGSRVTVAEPYPDALLEGLADWRASFCRDHVPPRLDRPTATDRANGQPAFGSYAGAPDTGASTRSG